MVDYMEKNGDLCKPASGSRGRISCHQKWQELTLKLNAEGSGESRSVERWKKVWSDFKNNTKRKWAKISRSVHGTGGGPAHKLYLNELEHRVLSIIGIRAAIGMPIAEIGVGEVTEASTIKGHEKNESLLILELPPPMPTPSHSSPVHHPHQILTTPKSSPQLRETSPQLQETSPQLQELSPQLPETSQKRKKKCNNVDDFFLKCEMNAREDNNRRDKIYFDIEKEKIRVRDDEIRMQGLWLEFMREALGLFKKYLDEKK